MVHGHHRAPHPGGKVYCAVVLDVRSRRVIGCSTGSSPMAALTTNTFRMAIDFRRPPPARSSQYGKIRPRAAPKMR